MTNYDMLIDTIQETLYTWYVTGQVDSQFDANKAKQDAEKLLLVVEEFRNSRLNNNQWRASD